MGIFNTSHRANRKKPTVNYTFDRYVQVLGEYQVPEASRKVNICRHHQRRLLPILCQRDSIVMNCPKKEQSKNQRFRRLFQGQRLYDLQHTCQQNIQSNLKEGTTTNYLL
jgi:hypothetical protein